MKKIKRFYDDIPNKLGKKKIDEDFDYIESLLRSIIIELKSPRIKLIHTPIEKALESRIQVIVYQQKLKAKFLLEGIITELNANNYIAILPLVRSFYEVSMLLGYLAHKVKTSEHITELLEGPIAQALLGNRNAGAGALAIGTIDSVNILTAIEHVEKMYLSDKSEKIFTSVYADLSNKCHPNYNSTMYLCSINTEGVLITLEDVGKSERQLKSLAYHEYMQPLQIAIKVFQHSVGKLLVDGG